MIIRPTEGTVSGHKLFLYTAFLVLAVFVILGTFAYHEFRQTQKMLDQILSTAEYSQTANWPAESRQYAEKDDSQTPHDREGMNQYIKKELNETQDTIYGEVTQISTVPDEGVRYVTIRTSVIDTDEINEAKIGESLPKKDIEYTAIFKSDTPVKDATPQDIRLGDFLAVSTGGKTIDSASFEAVSAEILKESPLHQQL